MDGGVTVDAGAALPRRLLLVGQGMESDVVDLLEALATSGGQRWEVLDPSTGLRHAADGYVLCAVDPGARRALWEVMGTLRPAAPAPVTLLHPTVWRAGDAICGAGTVIGAGAFVGELTRLGAHCLVGPGADIAHHVTLGDVVTVGAGALVAGEATIGSGVLVGPAAVVQQGVRVGEGAVIGAGAVVIRDVEAGVTVAGNPVRVLPARRDEFRYDEFRYDEFRYDGFRYDGFRRGAPPGRSDPAGDAVDLGGT